MVKYGSSTEEMRRHSPGLVHGLCVTVFAVMHVRLPLIACCFVGVLTGQPATGQFVFKKDFTFEELPAGIERRAAPGASNAEIQAMLSRQPSIVIDGAALVISPPSVGSSRSIAVKSIEFRNGGRLVTNGVNLELDAGIIVSDRGAILSFDESARQSTGQAGPGNSGKSGLSAGTVVMNASIRANDILLVSLPGQDGQRGGSGAGGAAGAPGPRGENGADHLFDCAHGAGNGGNGSQGGKGGSGGDGGAGGNGGHLILRGELAQKRVQIEFSALGGRGGDGGTGGPGGPGGAGGPGGSHTTYCRDGSPGANGPVGPPGDPGRRGPEGQKGSISSD